MQTVCNPSKNLFQPVGKRQVHADFNAGRISSDGGLLLLGQVAHYTQCFQKIAACFQDHRDPKRIEHPLDQLLAQRILGIACGYEDLNDHDTLRYDPALALAVGKQDPSGDDRKRSRDRGRALCGHATLNRIESAPATLNPSRPDLKVLHDPSAIAHLLTEMSLDSHEGTPQRIVLDLDATDDPIHGQQAGRFFHGYYGNYCFLPLYIFWGDRLLAASLRTSDVDPAIGGLEELQRVVCQIRSRWPDVAIWVRGDSGFCREELMSWCEQQGVEFVFGLARNSRLQEAIAPQQAAMAAQVKQTEESARTFCGFSYQTLKSWSRCRRVVAKVEQLVGKANPRFVVTSLSAEEFGDQSLYEELYCARGEMENRIKEQQLGLFADRTSAHELVANQLRLWFSGFAYVLLQTLREVGLRGTSLCRLQVWTLRSRFLKVGCLVRQSVRRVVVSLSSSFVYQSVFFRAAQQLRARFAVVT